MNSANLSGGRLVRITDRTSLAHNRIGLTALRNDDGKWVVSFVDYLMYAKTTEGSRHEFSAEQITFVEPCPPWGYCYLLVTIETLVGDQMYERYAIAHVTTLERPADVAETIAANFFGSLGEWDGEYYRWQRHSARRIKTEEITMAQYIELRKVVPDYDFGSEVKAPD